tara:strand:+ start:1436 stop:2080 length:645 start_codon:yes stop_codon:yes gene_type:complete
MIEVIRFFKITLPKFEMIESNKKYLSISIAGFLLIFGIVLLLERGGLFAWAGIILGIVLLIKILALPSLADVKISVLTTVTFVAAWAATYLAIILIWESGEIAELHVENSEGVSTIRVWVLDLDGDTIIFYDAEPEDAAILRGDPHISVTRESTEIEYSQIHVVSSEEAPTDSLNRVYEGWSEKYGNRTLATPVYSLMFGRSRTKKSFIITLTP